MRPKQYLPNNGIHYEATLVSAVDAGVRDEIQIGEFNYPIGDLVFDLSGIRIGFEICEDAWIASRPGRALYERGVDIILNPSASHFPLVNRVPASAWWSMRRGRLASATSTPTCWAMKPVGLSTMATPWWPPTANCWCRDRG